MKKNKLYLVGNAHLDPVWQWQWQEGSAEAKATIRSALDRMNEFPEFRFVCSSASVYQWVEEFAPEMFEEMRQRVKEGRFIIVGGHHVQPDCNLLSGEAYARQALYAQRYFYENFGVTAKTGYNVDSFGHNLMMPQILKKSGMDTYVFLRPAPEEKEMERDLFHWVSPDGSSVLTYRILDPYCFKFNSLEEVQQRINYLAEKNITDTDAIPFFYGVGNHGGGPTIRNLELLREYAELHPEMELVYSDVTDFFDYVRSSDIALPEHRDDLQHHAAGCYATVSHVKNGVRRSEANLVAAENYNILAGKLCGKKPKNTAFQEAWKNICFLHFHDSMDGCCYKPGHEDARYQYGAALNTAAVEENNALQTISWAIDTSDNSKGLPIVVFNPHGFPAEQIVQVNRHCTAVVDSKGNPVPSQLVNAPSVECTWRKDTIFKAKVPALGYAVYYVTVDTYLTVENASHPYQEVTPFENGTVKAIPYTGEFTANRQDGTILENEYYRIRFEHYTGFITSFVNKETGEEMITERAAVPVVIDEYYHDAWSHGKNFFTDVMARFSDAQVTVMERGPVRATVKVVSRYNDSTLTQYISLEAGSPKLSVRASVDWHEKHKMLKLRWPMNIESPKAYYEIPYGVIERPADGEEGPGLTWTAVKGNHGGFALLNSNTYSSSVKDGTIYQTVLRSPIYGDHGGPRSEESDYTDQGLFEFQYALMPVSDSWAPMIQEAKLLNKPVTNIIENWHKGYLMDKTYQGLHISADNVMLSAIKHSEDGKGLVIRIYETDGKETPVRIAGPLLPVALDVTITPWSANTYYLADGTNVWKEVLFTEFDV